MSRRRALLLSVPRPIFVQTRGFALLRASGFVTRPERHQMDACVVVIGRRRQLFMRCYIEVLLLVDLSECLKVNSTQNGINIGISLTGKCLSYFGDQFTSERLSVSPSANKKPCNYTFSLPNYLLSCIRGSGV